MKYKKIITLVVLLFYFIPSWSQKPPSILDEATTRFILHVKHIEDFFDRFNRDEHSNAFINLSELTNLSKVSRHKFVNALFSSRADFDTKSKEAFIQSTTSSNKLLSFYDNNWFVEIDGIFNYKQKQKNIQLILRANISSDNAVKWEIVAANADFLASDCHDIPEAKALTFLSPASHAIDFVSLHKAFKDTANLQNYFIDVEDDALIAFKKGLYNGELEYIQANQITYHFFQIPGWIFTVDYYGDDGSKKFNTGWLISSLYEAPKIADKEEYKRRTLNLYY